MVITGQYCGNFGGDHLAGALGAGAEAGPDAAEGLEAGLVADWGSNSFTVICRATVKPG